MLSSLTATSNCISGFEDADVVTLFAPSTLSNTHHIQINATVDAATTSAGWATLTSGGSLVTIAAGTAVTITDVAFGSLRVSSLGTETTTRTFTVVKQILV